LRWNVEKIFDQVGADLGDMPNERGESLWWEIERASTAITPLVVSQITPTSAYRFLLKSLPSEKVSIYFHKHVKRIIFPAVRALYVAQWQAKHMGSELRHEVIWTDHEGLGPALQAVWPDDSIPLMLVSRVKYSLAVRPLLVKLRNATRSIGRHARASFLRGSAPNLPITPENTISVHYREGVDSSRRSDTFWNADLLADPERILILIGGERTAYQGRRVPGEVLRQIEHAGMRWVCLEQGQVAQNGAPVWGQNCRGKSLLRQFQRELTSPSDPIELWAASVSRWLLGEIDYWASLFTDFNVKVHVDVAGANDRHIAQNIALDLIGGVRVGWQRSEQVSLDGWDIGHLSNHAYFTWNKRALADAEADRMHIGPVLISGFPYDGSWKEDNGQRKLRDGLIERGTQFTVALFDNMIMRDDIYSNNMLRNLYLAFLEWVLAEPHVGVITKSKKPSILQELPEIQGLMAEAEATGRWINLTDVFGRLPSDASRAADISVGIGISTAASEAVAAGGRAIHCDLPAMRSHPFYQWGYEKVVFDNLDRMMNALKRYMADPASEPGLGDFSSAMDQIDPFCDGKAGERIGSYIAHLLKSFDSDLDRDQAIHKANEDYAQKWGQESVRQAEYWSQERTTTL